MKRISAQFLVLALLLAACNSISLGIGSTAAPIMAEPSPTPGLCNGADLSAYNFLYIGIPVSDVFRTLGQPYDDVGSGVHIYRYKVTDDCYIWITMIPDTLAGMSLDVVSEKMLYRILPEPPKNRELADFSFITPSTTSDEIYDRVGFADKQKREHIPINMYVLQDGREVWVTSDQYGKLITVSLYDPQDGSVEILVEP